MRIMVLGGWGYLGWPTALRFSAGGHEVCIVDNYLKTDLETEVSAKPLRNPLSMHGRATAWKDVAGRCIDVYEIDITTPMLGRLIDGWQPDTIIHYAENPSAPYSMMNATRAVETQRNNIEGTLRILFAIKDTYIHLIKLGTMGEYGTPGIKIPDGWMDVAAQRENGSMVNVRLPFPKLPGSFYHASKVADSVNIEMACRLWGIRATDLNQGIVYGTSTKETELREDLFTSFHYDAVFGTALNRFIAQAAVGHPLTVYGKGGQTRGWLNIEDTLQCVSLAANTPPRPGEFRVLNQFTEIFSINELAIKVARVTGAAIEHIDNPRVELEQHFYEASNEGFKTLGLKPHLLNDSLLLKMFEYVSARRDNIDEKQLQPWIQWR